MGNLSIGSCPSNCKPAPTPLPQNRSATPIEAPHQAVRARRHKTSSDLDNPYRGRKPNNTDLPRAPYTIGADPNRSSESLDDVWKRHVRPRPTETLPTQSKPASTGASPWAKPHERRDGPRTRTTPNPNDPVITQRNHTHNTNRPGQAFSIIIFNPFGRPRLPFVSLPRFRDPHPPPLCAPFLRGFRTRRAAATRQTLSRTHRFGPRAGSPTSQPDPLANLALRPANIPCDHCFPTCAE